jgi:chemotaxis methyl-accepting protein methylase
MSTNKPNKQKELTLLKWRLKRRFGIDLGPYRGNYVERRVKARIFAKHLSTLEEYLTYLEAHPEEYNKLGEELLINVTKFFRRREAWVRLKRVIKEVIGEKEKKHRKRIRFWSAGCATGEEPYSLAILLKEVTENKIEEFNPKIFATDIDEEALNIAKAGVYTVDKVKEVGRDRVEKYFDVRGRKYWVKPEVKELVEFKKLDLFLPFPYTNLDLILCRNVMIYFSKTGQEKIISNLYDALKPEGYIMLGEVESLPPGFNDMFETIYQKYRIFQKIE